MSFGKLFSQEINYNFPKLKSSISMPVRVPLSELTNIANSSVTGLIFSDDSRVDNNNDQLRIKVWKTNPIKITSGAKQNFLIEVPIKIWIEKGIGTLGVYTYQETTFETVMHFNTSINFNPNWTISTQTVSKGFKWVSKPILDYGQVKIPITPLVESKLRTEQQKFCATMDKELSSKLNFQEMVVSAWNLFSEPFLISEEFQTWLKISPSKISVTPLVFYKDALDFSIGVEIFSETLTGAKPRAAALRTAAPAFSKADALPTNFLLQTTASIPYSEASKMAMEMFSGKEFDFRDSEHKIQIKDIKVYGKDGQVILEATTEGAVNGVSIITGTPVYDAQKRKIVLRETHFKLRTQNILHKAASLLFKNKIIRMIEEDYGIPTAELENYSRKSTEQAFNKDYYKGVKLSGRVTSLAPQKILVGVHGLTAIIDMQASVRLMLAGN